MQRVDVQSDGQLTMTAGAIPEVGISDLQARLNVREQRIPIEGVIETTFRCNLKCVHCYVNEPVGDREIRDCELSLERLKRLVDEIVEAGCLDLLFTGGEVLVRPDFPELYLYAVRKGLLVTIFTNGTMITDRIADLFDEYRPFNIEITLYGMTRETYERVTGLAGSYEMCLKGIRRLVSRGIPLKLKAMALTWNQHEVPAMEAYARSLGLKFKFDGFLNPRVDCGSNRNGELQMTAEQVIALDLQVPERMEEFKAFCEQNIQPIAPIDSEYVYSCGAGQMSFTVDPYGKLQMCQLSRRSSFDLRNDTFDRGWNEFFPMLRERKWQSNSVCRSCNLVSLCSSCPGAAEMETGDIEGIVAQFCEIAHLRAHTAMGDACGHRADATCCLGHGKLLARPPEEVERVMASASCGSSPSGGESPPTLIQIDRCAA
jgi:radical SAM protein with 4Fe4S-binding SPASM domain